MNRWKLGRACFRKVPISGIGVMNAQGSDENFSKVKELSAVQRTNYNEKLCKALEDVNAPQELIDNLT